MGKAKKEVTASYVLSDNFGVRAGYQSLEGGSGNDKIYGFALFLYASVGLSISF